MTGRVVSRDANRARSELAGPGTIPQSVGRSEEDAARPALDGRLPAEEETAREDIGNALTMLELCGVPSVGPRHGASYRVYRSEDIQAIAARLTTAMEKLEEERGPA